MSAHSNELSFSQKALRAVIMLAIFIAGVNVGFAWSTAVHRGSGNQSAPRSRSVDVAPFQAAYDLLLAATEETSLDECILLNDSFTEGYFQYNSGSMGRIAPDEAEERAVELLARCSGDASERLYGEADPRLPEPYTNSKVLSELPPYSGDRDYLGTTSCVEATTGFSDQLECIVDSFVEYEANIEQIVAEDDELSRPRWDAWSAYWSNTSVSAPVVKAMDSIRGEMDAQGDRSARQAYIAQEICLTDGEWREASLRVAVERRAAESGEEPGIAANAVYGEYFGTNPYGQYGDYGACSRLNA